MQMKAARGAVTVAFCVAFSGVLAVGCGIDKGDSGGSGSDGGTTCTPYVVPPGTDLMHPSVSFRSNVMKLFNDSCGASACHGQTGAPAGNLFLGLESARGGDAAMVRSGLVGHAAAELPSMALVAPGDPEHSYLMHKLDADQCQFATQCSGGDCMGSMPSGSLQPLPVETRDQVRRWIASGAGDD